MRKWDIAGTHLAGEVLKKRKIRPPKVEFEFTDLDLTGFGGASILARTARWFGLFELLEEAVSVKVRDRGATDAETLWAMVASLCRGHGALSDLDALRADGVARVLLGLREVPEARRAALRGSLERFNEAPDDGWRWDPEALAVYLLHDLCGVALVGWPEPPGGGEQADASGDTAGATG